MGNPLPLEECSQKMYNCSMKQTMLLKLVPTEDQRQALLETMHAFNQAANSVARVAFAD
jgi:hypothetical protein